MKFITLELLTSFANSFATKIETVFAKKEDTASKTHTHESSDIVSLDASKLTGKIDIERLPAGALERCVVVADDTARLALTTDNIQVGDTVKVTATDKLYFVVDDTKLSTEEGYEPYTAGAATSVDWTGITGKPETYTPSTHTHTISDISDLEEATETDIDNVIAGVFTE